MNFGLPSLRQRAASFARGSAAATGRGAGWASREEAIMGTAIRVELWADDAATATSAMAAVMDEMHRVDRAMSPHKPDSELSRINRDAALMPVPLSAEMYGLIACALRFSALSDGAFDISFASVGNLYDYRLGLAPSAAVLAQGRAAIGWRHLLLDPQSRSIRFAREGMRIDLGGFAKGHAVDNATAILARRGIRHAIVSAGGDSRVIGDRRGRPWTIAIADPRRPGEVVAVLPLENVAISTSGDYERYFERDGVRCHHLIDPRTGRSPSGVHSVTILADDGLTSEALSKSLFVLGLEQGMRLIESQPGVDAVVVDAQGALHYSSGLLGGVTTQPLTRQ
ncbi:FAD:protein FMN transferase [Rivibacter subsaxonicus]|uniref:FAD:protein FMN transferase n=1 Tax=Rivibacter subsaxonicus TaxID=457575 RepID=A0A4Q7W1S8_9BURK|nr:FAD:protein FMN transferase [Rivibacter subsaxonicus]RZU02805.1 thiamine biosynthesis lipoprotein [Rivibacter subsaxonicus]